MKTDLRHILLTLLVATRISSGAAVATTNIEPKGFHKRIDTLILKRDFTQAQKLAEAAYAQHPGEPEVICALACVYRNQSATSAIQLDLGSVGLKDGETGTVTLPHDSASLKKIFQEKSTYEPELHHKAELLYLKILDLDPQYLNAYFNLLDDDADMGRFEDYFKIVDIFISRVSGKEVREESLLDLAGKLAKNQDIDLSIAIRMYEKILSAFPDYAFAKSDLAAVFYKQGQVEKSIRLFREAYQADPSDRINLTNLTHALIDQEQFEDAYALAKKLAPMDTLCHFLCGLLAYRTGKPFQAHLSTLMSLRKRTEADPDKDFWYTNAKEFMEVGKKKPTERKEFFEFLEDNFHSGEMNSEAILSGNIALQSEASAFSLVTLASIYDGKSNLEKTVKYLDMIRDQRKSHPDIMTEYNLYSNYARIYLVQNHFAEAREYLLKTQGMVKHDARLNHYLGLCAEGLGNKDQAIVYYRENRNMEDKDQMEWINKSVLKLRQLGK